MWLLPTLNRIEKLTHFLNSAIAAGTTTIGQILVDESDFAANMDAYKALPLPKDWFIHITTGVTMGEKVREVWDSVQDCEWIAILNDDFEIVTPEWDKKLIAKLNGKNFVSTSDRKVRSFIKPSGATVWSMPLLKAAGIPMFPPGLNHLYIDDLWLQIGRATGTWSMRAEVVILHKHVLDNEMAADATFHKTYDDFFAGKSKDLDMYNLFMKHDFNEVVKKIKEFQDEIPGQKHNPKVSATPA